MNNFFGKIKDNYIAAPLKTALTNLASISSGDETLDTAIITLLSTVVWDDGVLTTNELEELTYFLTQSYSERQVNKFIHIIEEKEIQDLDRAIDIIKGLTDADKTNLLLALFAIAYSDTTTIKPEDCIVYTLGKRLDYSEVTLKNIENQFLKEKRNRDTVIKSGTGVCIAFVILFIFCMAATFLRSVLFGIIGAYISLPIALFFSQKLSKNKLLTKLFTKKGSSEQSSFLQVSLPLYITIFTIAAGALILVLGISELSAHQVSAAGNYVDSLVESGTPQKIITYVKEKADSLPYVNNVISELSNFLKDPTNKNDITNFLSEKAAKLLGTASGVLGFVSSLALDLLLALFFFMFFLQKMIHFTSQATIKANPSTYFVESIFSSKWMPQTSAEARGEASLIIANVFSRLHTWIRGYFSVILLESILYITAFTALGLPSPFILGAIAGSTILLPFVGPLLSSSLTIIVYLAVAGTGSSVGTIIIIISIYGIMNGILEQFIIYPFFVGEKLGLTTLETVIIVLLGGIFAGVSGMIFSVPLASVLKYIIPKLYVRWDKTEKLQ